MSIIGLLIAVVATVVVIMLTREGKIPSPFDWILYLVLVVVWIVVLLQVTGLGGSLYLGRV